MWSDVESARRSRCCKGEGSHFHAGMEWGLTSFQRSRMLRVWQSTAAPVAGSRGVRGQPESLLISSMVAESFTFVSCSASYRVGTLTPHTLTKLPTLTPSPNSPHSHPHQTPHPSHPHQTPHTHTSRVSAEQSPPPVDHLLHCMVERPPSLPRTSLQVSILSVYSSILSVFSSKLSVIY